MRFDGRVGWCLVALLVTGTACTCEPRLQFGNDDLRTPDAVVFGSVPLAATSHRTLELTNASRRALTLRVATSTPFALPDSVLVPAGATIALDVTFSPVQLGSAEGAITLTADGLSREIPMSGVGVDACRATGVCLLSAYDDTQGHCVELAREAGTPCSDACVIGGTCQEGACVGDLSRCDDGDRCTVDACATDAGCSHSPRFCDVDDPCRVAICDSVLGCSSVDVADGTSCGEASCAVAQVCIAGRCERRTRPGSEVACLAVEIAVGGAHVCMTTAANTTRCWGHRLGIEGRRQITSSPHEVPSLNGLHGLVAYELTTCGISDGGAVICEVGRGSPITIPFSAPAKQLSRGDYPMALLETGALERFDGVTVSSVLDGGVLALFPHRPATWLLADGGGGSIAGPFPLPPHPRDAVYQGHLFNGVLAGVLTASGGYATVFTDGGIVEFVDGGVLAMSDNPWCISYAAGGVDCTSASPDTGGWGYPSVPLYRLDGYDDAIVQIDPSVRTFALCGVSATGAAYCMGTNDYGQMGDRSVQPRGVVQANFAHPIRRLGVTADPRYFSPFGRTVGWDSAELWSFGSINGTPMPADGGALPLGPARDVEQIEITGLSNCLLTTSGQVWSWTTDTSSLSLYPELFPALEIVGFESFGGGCGARMVDRVAIERVPFPASVAALRSPGCALLLDGGVGCFTSSAFGLSEREGFVPAYLPLPALDLSRTNHPVSEPPMDGACAVVVDGTVQCWSGLGHGVFTSPPGLPPFPRQIVGTGQSGCALFGSNGVRCWGTNEHGQLGRDDPEWAVSAVDVAIREPIDSLFSSGVHTCALATSGRVWCWGANASGQLGTPVHRTSSGFWKIEP